MFMSDSQEFLLYKQILDVQFASLRELMDTKFATVDIKLDNIYKQASLTNSRVNHLETDVIELEDKVDKAIEEAHHVIDTRSTTCPNIPRIEKVENKLDDIKEWKATETGIKTENRILGDIRVRTVTTVIAFLMLASTIFFSWRKTQKEIADVRTAVELQNEMTIQNGGAKNIINNTRGTVIADSTHRDTDYHE